ncbi:uncharacterized protein LOC131216578 [Anopheles bellator]|uniref:uncharacterized protein LOC131216578 n=1 Tax=Anopheles bellator TaxID=139047 RepID=UPI00264A18C5|nr:uncharacterized protein LOC131216578 [Anopheles bellator]
MYKSTVVFALLCGVALSMAYPYPQHAFMYYRNAYPMMGLPLLQQSAMYQQAMYQHQRLRSHRRSATSGVAAFASGDDIATGTLLKTDCRPPADPVAPAVQSFADAYPAEASPENDIPYGDEGDLLADPGASSVGSAFDGASVVDDTGLEPLAPSVAVPDKQKKKVTTVQLDSASEEEQDDDAGEEPSAVSFGTRRGNSSKPGAASGGSMFPVTFGSTNGGAIAIANSYSTGKGGSATSHATAYGSPASVPEDRRRSIVAQQQLRSINSNRPAKLRNKY